MLVIYISNMKGEYKTACYVDTNLSNHSKMATHFNNYVINKEDLKFVLGIQPVTLVHLIWLYY